MRYLLNSLYLLALLALSPWLVYKALTTGKYRRGLWCKLLGRTSFRAPDELSSSLRVAWFHGVSVGEIHLLRQVIAAFRQRYPEWRCVVSTTTDTGFEEARKRFEDLSIFYWPFDFSWAVERALREVRPSLVILAEGEVWPNFLLAAKRRGLPVALINGRMSPRSHTRYRRLLWAVRGLFARLDLLGVQTEDYAVCYRDLGALPSRIHVTGSVKYDGVETNRLQQRTQDLGRLLNVVPGDLVWIAGSTQDPEEQLALDIYRRAKLDHPRLRLLLVPRQKERFDEVAKLLKNSGLPWVRRSELHRPTDQCDGVILMDTIGELGALWGLADVALVGGSFDGKRGGQNMIEPAAYGAAVVFGPHVWNFRDTAERLTAAGGALQVAGAIELENVVRRLLAEPAERQELGLAARRFVLQQQGATAHTVELLGKLMPLAWHLGVAI